MTEKQCANCGKINPADVNFCSNCGYSEFNDIPQQLHTRLADATESARSSAVRINISRIILVSFLSTGLYFFYWFYITWKHLSTEIEGKNYPFWHAMTLNVPVYGMFRLHAHVRIINELAVRQSITTTLAPGLAVVLLVLATTLNFASIGITNRLAIIVVTLISATLVTVLMAMAQGTLNLYWEKALSPRSVTDARIGAGEVIIVIVGIIFWILLLIPPSAYEQSDSSF